MESYTFGSSRIFGNKQNSRKFWDSVKKKKKKEKKKSETKERKKERKQTNKTKQNKTKQRPKTNKKKKPHKTNKQTNKKTQPDIEIAKWETHFKNVLNHRLRLTDQHDDQDRAEPQEDGTNISEYQCMKYASPC